MKGVIENITPLNAKIQEFDPIRLDELSDDTLLKRKENKFFFSKAKLLDVISIFQKDFRILEIDRERIHQYNSTYLDTENFDTYLRHHNKRKNRFKLRFRDYETSNISFFEIKQKTNKDLTIKHRTEIPYQSRTTNQSIQNFVNNFLDVDLQEFKNSINTRYLRISLISPNKDGRITIDVDLNMEYKDEKVDKSQIVIMEMKYSRGFEFNRYLRALKDLNILPHRISKYCIGVSYLIPNIKKNNFKMNLRRISQIHRLQTDI